MKVTSTSIRRTLGIGLTALSLAAVATAAPTGGDAQTSPTCAGRVATIVLKESQIGQLVVGTDGDDVVVGTAGNDRFFGAGGRDLICLRGGND